MFSELLFNQKVVRQMAKDRQKQDLSPMHRDGTSKNEKIDKVSTDESTAIVLSPIEYSEQCPGPAARDTRPLRSLFSEHLQKVSRIPLILNNMPLYYSIVNAALESTLEQFDFEVRAQALSAQSQTLHLDHLCDGFK